MTSVRATEERPGADPLRPHADLLVPSSSSSLRPGSNSTLAHPLWANDQDSAATPLRFGSIAPSATPASSSSSSNAAALSPATQVASLHRAAEVARWEWSKDHDVPLSTQGSPRPTTPVAAAPPTSRSTGIGLIDVSDDSGASSSETLSGGESTTTSTSTSSESFDADAVERAFVAQMEARTQSTTRRPRPRNAVSSTGGLQADIESWSRMVYDLGCAAGVVVDGEVEHVFSYSSSSARHTPPPPFLFGYTPGSRLFPHPWWARRYSGPAGAWLRSELLRRARDQPQPSSTAATQTPASAMANEWRRQSTAAAAATSRRGDDGIMLSFPSLDPQTRSGAASTTFPAIRLEPTTSNEGTAGQPSAQAQPPPAAVPATSSTSVAVPSSTSASSFMTPGLFNPWRSPSAARPTTDTSSVTSTSQLLANPSRPPRTSHPPAASNVDRSITAGVLELTAAVRAQQGAVGSGRPPAAASSAASRHETLPESAFQVPDASEAQRREAAQTVARLASAQRSAAATAAQRRAEPSQSSISTTRRTGEQQQQQRRREGHGMTYLRHLRSLDGIDSTPWPSSAPVASAASSSSSSTPVQAYQVFPWYTPPTLDLAPAEVDATPSTPPPRLADPDGDAQGADWYRGVRARQENAQEEAAALRGLQDPNGEAMMLDDGDVAGVQGGMSLPPWRPRAPRPREGDDEDGVGRQGAARRQRNRTALVLATEDYDDDNQAGNGQRPQRGGSAINDGAAGGDEVATAGGWTLINPLFRNDEQQQQPHSPVRETRDEGSENTTNWLRGPNSTSPGPMASTTSASPPTSLRSLRRPRRLRSLASEDIVGAAGTSNNDSIAASFASLPTTSVQDAAPVRRAEHHGRRGTGAADNVRSMTIDELRDREERVHRLSLGGEAAVGQTPSHRASASASASASTPAAAALSPPSTSSPWLSRISQNIEAELQQRQEELRASQQRLGEELTRRRRHLDELRQRQGRIGRVLERTAEAARIADRAGEDLTPASSSSSQPAADAAATPTPVAASLVRRRSLRDPAPAGLRAPRAVRLSQPASDPAPSSSPHLRRSTSSATLGEDKELEEREAALAGSSSSSSSSAPRAVDDLALSSSPSSRSSGSGASSNVDLTRRNDSPPCLITPEDQARLGIQGTRLLRALDELGQRCGAYQEAALQAHRQRLLTWAPQQPALPSTAVPSARHHGGGSSSSSNVASATSYPLRFEPSRHEPQPSGARSILRHDQNGLRFNAAEGVDVVLRFLAALPPTSSSTNSATTSAYPISRQAEDRLWAAGRQRLLQRGRGTGSPATDAHEAHNERRRALGMAPRERQSDRDLERDARERERAREALPSITATPFGYMPITSINGGGPSGRTSWPQILARRPDLTAREYAVLSRFDLSSSSASDGGGGGGRGGDEDEQTTPIQQPFSRASSLSALRSLSSEDIDVLRALVLRTTRGPGGFGAATSSRAAAASGSNARGQSSQDDDDEEDLGSSDEESFPATARVESTTAATATRRTSSTLPGPALPSLFPSRAIALSEEDVQAIRSMAGTFFSTTAEQLTSSSQQGEGTTAITNDGDGDNLVLRLASMDTAMAFIRRRAEAIAQAGEGRSSSNSSAEPAVADPLGPLFTLSSLSLSLTRRACAAATSSTGSSSRSEQQQRHQPAMTLHALVFVSDEPISKDDLREWQGKTAREVRQVVAAISGAGAAVGPGLAEEEEQEEADQEEWDEDADLGDPFALERRAASTARRQSSEQPNTSATTTNSDDAPHLLPRALIPFTFPGTSSSSGAQMTMTTSQNINFDRPVTAPATANAQTQTQQARRRPALPIGRYLAVKLLPTTTSSTEGEGEEDGEGASLDAAAAAVELSYVGARGWPAAGMSSVAGGECL